MFRPIRRKKNELGREDSIKLLCEARRGVLAVNGDDGYPYAIPVNYLYDKENEKIYFHGAKAGHKVDAINACDKVCFTVYGDEIIKDEDWAPYVQSVVVFGRCHLITDFEQAMELTRGIARKYYPNAELIEKEMAADGKNVQVFEIDVEHLCGKEVQEK